MEHTRLDRLRPEGTSQGAARNATRDPIRGRKAPRAETAWICQRYLARFMCTGDMSVSASSCSSPGPDSLSMLCWDALSLESLSTNTAVLKDELLMVLKPTTSTSRRVTPQPGALLGVAPTRCPPPGCHRNQMPTWMSPQPATLLGALPLSSTACILPSSSCCAVSRPCVHGSPEIRTTGWGTYGISHVLTCTKTGVVKGVLLNYYTGAGLHFPPG